MKTSPRPPDYSAASPDAMPRRGLLKSLAALVALPRATPASPPAGPAPDSAILELPSHGHWRIEVSDDGWKSQFVPRWDVPAIAATEQPLPAFTEVSWMVTSMIFRWWEPGDVARCRLCPRCNASVTEYGAHPGLAICVREAAGRVTAEEAVLHRGGREVISSNEQCEDDFLGPTDLYDDADDAATEGGAS